jgi:hypothetical protein
MEYCASRIEYSDILYNLPIDQSTSLLIKNIGFRLSVFSFQTNTKNSSLSV